MTSDNKRRRIVAPPFVEPQLAKLADEVPQGTDWLHELKYDGYRILARKVGDVVKIIIEDQKFTIEELEHYIHTA